MTILLDSEGSQGGNYTPRRATVGCVHLVAEARRR